MSLPSFPVVNPPIEREDAVNQILSSIAMEELGLSHILNAEGEKLQYILGTLPGLSGPPATVSDVLAANESVRSMLETAAQNQLFLKAKMQGALTASPMQGPTGATGPTGASGPTGATGPNLTSTAGFAANTQGSSVLVALGQPNPPAQRPSSVPRHHGQHREHGVYRGHGGHLSDILPCEYHCGPADGNPAGDQRGEQHPLYHQPGGLNL